MLAQNNYVIEVDGGGTRRLRRRQTSAKTSAKTLTKYFFKDWREFNLKLYQYMYYYNQERNQGGINYLTPIEKLLKLEIENSPNFKGRVGDVTLTTNSNHFVTEFG